MSDMWPWQPAPTEKPKSSLEDKLLKILASSELMGNKLEAIKQAFIDEGWHESV